jgi:hypothetical protein
MTKRFNAPLTVGFVATTLALGFAHAEPKQSQRSNMPSASAASTTSGTTSKSQAKPHAAQERSNMPASSSSTTKSATKNDEASADASRAQAPQAELQDPEGIAPDAAVVDLDQVAPVEIIDLQHRLKVRGLYQGDLDGIAGPQTRGALRQYFVKQATLALQGKLDTASVSFCGPVLDRPL